jgi:hypothetical protein
MALSQAHLKPTLNGAPLINHTILCNDGAGQQLPSYWTQPLRINIKTIVMLAHGFVYKIRPV